MRGNPQGRTAWRPSRRRGGAAGASKPAKWQVLGCLSRIRGAEDEKNRILADTIWARTGIDSTMPEATAGHGCLVGHVKHRGKNELTKFKKTSLQAWLRLMRFSRSLGTSTAGLLCRLNAVTRSLWDARYYRSNDTASKRGVGARYLPTGGVGLTEDGSPPKEACNSVAKESSKTKSSNLFRVHQFEVQ